MVLDSKFNFFVRNVLLLTGFCIGTADANMICNETFISSFKFAKGLDHYQVENDVTDYCSIEDEKIP
jgi:hypothetical protein